MNKSILTVIIIAIFTAVSARAATVEDRMSDTMETKNGPIQIELLGHASLRFQMGGKLIYVDPVMDFYRREDFGKADLVLVTHSHQDHLQPDLINKLKRGEAEVYLSSDCFREYEGGKVLHNGKKTFLADIVIQAVPAYNILHKRENGEPFHPKGAGNGYVITFGEKRLYVAGDTEFIPEMSDLAGVDAVFLPANLPYTMTSKMFIQAVGVLKPQRVYPYHYRFGTSIVHEIIPILRERKIDVRIPE